MNMFLLLLCFRELFAAKHSLKYFFTETPGAQSIPEFVGVGFIDGVQFGSWNSRRGEDFKKDWIKFFEDEPQLLQEYISECSFSHNYFKETIKTLKQHLNQTKGVHVLQRMSGCEWDDETGEVNGYNQYGYDGEDFLAFDPQTLTWITSKQQAETTKLKWNTEHALLELVKNFVINSCPEFLKNHLNYGRSFLEEEILPSVSLLQKTPSSPVSCHATGFYPQRAVMFWRKDGEEIHESVDHGEILPNDDGTFQMSVDLNVSSVTPEDWSRYQCVFQLSDGEENIITRLNETVIRTNWVENNTKERPSYMMIIPAVVVSVVFVIIGFCVFKKKRERKSEQTSGNIYGLSERLNPEAP